MGDKHEPQKIPKITVAILPHPATLLNMKYQAIKAAIEKDVRRALNKGAKLLRVSFGDGHSTCCVMTAHLFGKKRRLDEFIKAAQKRYEMGRDQVWAVIIGFDRERDDGTAYEANKFPGYASFGQEMRKYLDK